MNAEVFVDTNVFLYSISDQQEEQAKADRARVVAYRELGLVGSGRRGILLHSYLS